MRALMAGVLWAELATAAHSASSKPSPPAASRPALPSAVARHQIAVQIDKPKDRGLGWYNHFFFNEAGHLYESLPEEPPTAMTRIVPDAELQQSFSAEGNLGRLLKERQVREGRRVHWADWGGGLGMAQRELARWGPLREGELLMTAVDVIDWERRLVDGAFLASLPEARRQTLAPAYRPRLILSDATKVRFPREEWPDLITSVESVQYWDDKLAGLANAYNQLTDGGIVAVAAKHLPWGASIRTRGLARDDETSLDAVLNDPMLGGFFQALSAAGVGFLAWIERPGFPLQAVTRLVIRRRPGTSLSVEARFDGALENSAGYKTSFYQALPPEQPPVRVVSSP